MSAPFRRIRREIAWSLRSYAERYQNEGDEHRRAELVESYLEVAERLLRYIVFWQHRSFYTLGVAQDDLMQWARLAALEAIERYDLSRDTDFTSYLVTYVKRFVYNKVLDELPIPRSISKSMNRYADPDEMPECLRSAYMIRSPITVDSCLMEGIGWRSEEAPFDETVDEIKQELGASLWSDLVQLIDDPEDYPYLESVMLCVRAAEHLCEDHLKPYLNNLTRYLTSLLERRIGHEIHHTGYGGACAERDLAETRTAW